MSDDNEGMERSRRYADASLRYEKAMHAVQSGVLAHLRLDPAMKGVPEVVIQKLKDHRTGIDGSKSDVRGLVKLLIGLGLFDEVSYLEALADAAEAEKALYEKFVSELAGKKISLA